MLWNHDHKLAFCHTPRTGGTALREAFFVPGKGTLEFEHAGYKHFSWKELDRKIQDRIRNYTIICVHRDLYDRMISMYQHWILRPGRAHYHRCEFEEWITSTRYNIYPREHRLPQSHYCDGLPKQTIYIPFANLGGAWDYLRNNVSKSLQFQLKSRINPSTEYVLRSRVLTPVAVQWINQHHAEDFDRFGYKKLDAPE